MLEPFFVVSALFLPLSLFILPKVTLRGDFALAPTAPFWARLFDGLKLEKLLMMLL